MNRSLILTLTSTALFATGCIDTAPPSSDPTDDDSGTDTFEPVSHTTCGVKNHDTDPGWTAVQYNDGWFADACAHVNLHWYDPTTVIETIDTASFAQYTGTFTLAQVGAYNAAVAHCQASTLTMHGNFIDDDTSTTVTFLTLSAAATAVTEFTGSGYKIDSCRAVVNGVPHPFHTDGGSLGFGGQITQIELTTSTPTSATGTQIYALTDANPQNQIQ